MIIKSLGSIFGFTTGDSSFLKELLHVFLCIVDPAWRAGEEEIL